MQRPGSHHFLLVGCITILSFLFTVPLFAQGDYVVTREVREAYNLAMSLKLESAQNRVNAIRGRDPQNLCADFIEDYIDFFRIFISEERSLYDQLVPRRERRLQRLEEGDATSPYHLFFQAEIHLHWALIKFKFEENLSAAREVNRAFKLLKRNARKFPQFGPTYKSLGMLRAGVGTIPDKYRWAVKLLSSLEGTIDQGLADMQRAIRSAEQDEAFNLKETYIFYAIGLLHFGNDGEMAWQVLQRAGLKPAKNVVDCFVLSNVAMKTQRNEEAIRLLATRPVTPGIHPFVYLEFSLGLAKLYRNDADADQHLLTFVRSFRGINYIKEAYQKLAWHYLIHGDVVGYKAMLQQVLNKGHAITDEDAHAQKEAESGVTPHPALLRARLLFDGGYYAPALDALEAVEQNTLSAEQQLEYTYRRGRLHHALKQYDEAKEYYDLAIARGSNSKLYFACNAALQAGLIHEISGQYQAAAGYFRTCLSMKPADYQSSLHQKAKSGLNRIKSKI